MDPRFRRVLRPLSAVTVVVFTWFSLEPWNIAIAAPPLPAPESSNASPSIPPVSPPDNTVHEVRKLLLDMQGDVAGGRDITLQLEALKSHRNKLESNDQKVRKDFDRTGEKIREAGLPEVILKRQEEAESRYRAAYERLQKEIDSINALEAERKQTVRDNDPVTGNRVRETLEKTLGRAAEELKSSEPPSRYLPGKPDSLPNRMREIKKADRFDLSKGSPGSAPTPDQQGALSVPEKKKVSWLGKVYDFMVPSAYGAEPGPTPADLAPTLDAPITQEITDLAAQLDNNSVKIYEFVRNGFKFEAYRGSMKGASQTLVEKAGNDVDQASLLIALYRAAGIGAHYVKGTIEVPMDRAKAWTGIDDPQMVGALFMSQGIPTTLMYRGAQPVAIRTEHVWVEAYVPFLNGRGALNGPGDTWVQMDPSFKTNTITQTLSLPNVPTFDQAAYLSTFRTESPLDFYKANLQTFLDANAPNYVPEALARKTEIEYEFLGILVGIPPYKILSTDSTFSEVPDSLRQKFTLTIQDPITAETELTYTVPMPSVIGKRVTLSYAPATPSDTQTIATYGSVYDTPPYLIHLIPQIKLDGEVVSQGGPVGAGHDQVMRFTFNDGFYLEQVENTVIAGEYYAIALDGQNVTREEAFNRSQRLAQINETIDLADYSTLDDRLGELLYLSALTFHQNLDAGIREIGPLHHVADVRDVSEMMYFLTVQVDSIFGVPRAITPVGITGDLDRDTHLVVPVDGDLSRIKAFITLEGTQSSYLEHKVTEGIYQTEAISAVKAVQLAHDLSVPVYTVSKQNVATLLPVLQLPSDLEAEIANAANAGMEITVPEHNLVVQDWTGVGYIVQNPINGEGAYRISGGFGGVSSVAQALRLDILSLAMPIFAENALEAFVFRVHCYPSTDNKMFTPDDLCFFEVLLQEVDEANTNPPVANPCKHDKDAPILESCIFKYYTNPRTIALPLIEVTNGFRRNDNALFLGKGANLTKNITAEDWQSQDNAPYMRSGLTILTIVEELMSFFDATDHQLRPEGSGYRTKLRNDVTGGKPFSFHMNGVAADITLIGSNPIDPCEVYGQALALIGIAGQVATENKDNTRHISMPTIAWHDKRKC